MASSTDKSREPSDDESVVHPSSTEAAVRRHSRRPEDQPPVLPDRSSDETEIGWGDESSRYDDDWYLNERPPHHGS
jgi:hypothetical protein